MAFLKYSLQKYLTFLYKIEFMSINGEFYAQGSDSEWSKQDAG
jgi:hypothetical protein